jgi:hypothetical protein
MTRTVNINTNSVLGCRMRMLTHPASREVMNTSPLSRVGTDAFDWGFSQVMYGQNIGTDDGDLIYCIRNIENMPLSITLGGQSQRTSAVTGLLDVPPPLTILESGSSSAVPPPAAIPEGRRDQSLAGALGFGSALPPPVLGEGRGLPPPLCSQRRLSRVPFENAGSHAVRRARWNLGTRCVKGNSPNTININKTI